MARIFGKRLYAQHTLHEIANVMRQVHPVIL